MRIDDLTLEVRDRDLKRVGQITPTFLNLKATLRWCAVGEWSLTLPGDHPMVDHLVKPGSGVVLVGPDGSVRHPTVFDGNGTIVRAPYTETIYGTVMSGPTATPARKRDAQNPDGTYTFKGVTDEIHLLDALAYPSPLVADVSAQTAANDVRSGATESLMRQYVAYNIANGALKVPAVSWAPAGRLRGIRSKIVIGGADQTRGATAVKSPRFQNLLELLREIVLLDPVIGFRMVQRGDVIEFQVLDSRDRTSLVRFDVENGTLTSEEVQQSGPSVTYPIIAGQGEGVERQIIARTNDEAIAAEASWGRVIETFIDQRDTDDTIELEQSGDEALEEGRGGTSVKVIPADETTMQYGVDWRAGDQVTVVVNGVEAPTSVTETALLVNADGVRAGAALGDVSSFTKQDSLGAKVDALDVRVAQLERAGGLAERLNGKQIDDWNSISEPGFYWANNATNAPVPGMVMGQAIVDGAGRIVVQAPDPTDLMGKTWRRVLSTTWGAWKLTGSAGLPDPVQATASGTITAASFSGFGPAVDIDVPAACWARIDAHGWVSAAASTDLRVGVIAAGATVQAANESHNIEPSWGSVMWIANAYEQRQITKTIRLNPGVTTFRFAAYRIGSGVASLSYGDFAVTPERWA